MSNWKLGLNIDVKIFELPFHWIYFEWIITVTSISRKILFKIRISTLIKKLKLNFLWVFRFSQNFFFVNKKKKFFLWNFLWFVYRLKKFIRDFAGSGKGKWVLYFARLLYFSSSFSKFIFNKKQIQLILNLSQFLMLFENIQYFQFAIFCFETLHE